MEQKKIFPNLTGLRFFCFLGVLVFHMFQNNLSSIPASGVPGFLYNMILKGQYALDLFYVLSGFLITYQILVEIQTNGKLNFVNFMLRRILRIWPLYFLVLFLMYIPLDQLSLLMQNESLHLPPFWTMISFTSNLYYHYKSVDFFSPAIIIWSISLEEQFYLFWGIMFLVFSKRPGLILLICLLLFGYAYIYYGGSIGHFHSAKYIPHFVFGGTLSWLLVKKEKWLLLPKRWGPVISFLIYLLLLGLILFFDTITEKWSITLLAFAYILLIYDQGVNKNRWINFGESRAIKYLGKISYGLYCYHGFIIVGYLIIKDRFAFPENAGMLAISTIVVLSATILISHLSYYYFEKIFLTLKNRFRGETKLSG